MSYCTHEEATALIGPTLTASTPVTITEATAIIAGIDAEIDAHLEARGNPTLDAAFLKHVSTHGAAARIARAYWPGASGPGSSGGAAGELAEEYARQLAFIDALAVTAGSDDEPADAIANGFANAAGTTNEPFWTRGMEF